MTKKMTSFFFLLTLLIVTSCGQGQAPGDAELINGSIVGGTKVADFNEFAHIVAVSGTLTDERTGRPVKQELHGFCGGTLIAEQWVLTAAHCLGVTPKYVSTGSTSKKGYTAKMKVLKVIVHPDFRTNSVGLPYNDIALLKIEKSEYASTLDFSKFSLHKEQDFSLEAGSMVKVMGWGAECESYLCQILTPDSLKAVEVPVVDNSEASSASSYGAFFDEEAMLAAGMTDGGKDACQGDSGGPLIMQDGDKSVLVGVVSAGVGCARAKYYGLYARVSTYTDWVERMMDSE